MFSIRKPTKKLAKFSREEMHRFMWHWLADHPYASKSEFFVTYKIKEIPISQCYACSETVQRYYKDAYAIGVYKDCANCPIPWCKTPTVRLANCVDDSSPYAEWVVARRESRWKDASDLARRIAEMEWRAVK